MERKTAKLRRFRDRRNVEKDSEHCEGAIEWEGEVGERGWGWRRAGNKNLRNDFRACYRRPIERSFRVERSASRVAQIELVVENENRVSTASAKGHNQSGLGTAQPPGEENRHWQSKF